MGEGEAAATPRPRRTHLKSSSLAWSRATSATTASAHSSSCIFFVVIGGRRVDVKPNRLCGVQRQTNDRASPLAFWSAASSSLRALSILLSVVTHESNSRRCHSECPVRVGSVVRVSPVKQRLSVRPQKESACMQLLLARWAILIRTWAWRFSFRGVRV